MSVDLVQRVRRRQVSETATVIESPIALRVTGAELSKAALHEVGVRPIQVLLALATGKYANVQRQHVVVPTRDGTEVSGPLEWRTQLLDGTLEPLRDRYGFVYTDLAELDGSFGRCFASAQALESL